MIPSFTLQDVTVLAACILLYVIPNHIRRQAVKTSSSHEGYILRNRVTHARLLPVNSMHSFTYPTVSVLVSIDALESGRLNVLGGLLFGYGATIGRLLGLRSKYYLERGPGSLRSKLTALLTSRGYLTPRSSCLESAWMMTMPSFLGFEGINPLTVYFCYKADSVWLVILEIHNTFGETHAHVLEVGHNEDPSPPSGFDHQWTFRREFHVSPFNDRTGFYTVAVKAPSHPPTSHGSYAVESPKPVVRIHLYTDTAELPLGTREIGPLKLTAVLRPLRAEPLNALGILSTLTWAPFSLLLSLPRILLEAWTLHYRKRLDVFIRPEPLAPVDQRTVLRTAPIDQLAGGVAWRSETLFEKYAKRRVKSFLDRKAEESRVTVLLVPFDPASKPTQFGNNDAVPQENQLTIWYAAPRIFTILLMSPSPQHAYLLGCETERIFYVSSNTLFLDVFSASTSAFPAARSLPQTLRAKPIPSSISLEVPHAHPLDHKSVLGTFVDIASIWIFLRLESLEAWIFQVASARVVPGDEPWKEWERAGKVLSGYSKGERKAVSAVGSVRENS